MTARKLFLRHQLLIEQRDGRVGDSVGELNAFFIPRRNYFLGKYLKYGGTYPDPAIRLVKKGKAMPDCHKKKLTTGSARTIITKIFATFAVFIESGRNKISLVICNQL